MLNLFQLYSMQPFLKIRKLEQTINLNLIMHEQVDKM